MLTEVDLRRGRGMWPSGSDLIRAKRLTAATSQNTYTTLARLAKALEVCRKCQWHRVRYLGRTHPLNQGTARRQG
jgi:hypothetical protein